MAQPTHTRRLAAVLLAAAACHAVQGSMPAPPEPTLVKPHRGFTELTPSYNLDIQTPPEDIDTTPRAKGTSSKTRAGITRTGTSAGGSCVDYTAENWWSGDTKKSGLPGSGYVSKPDTITTCELEQLHMDCIERINMYRSGGLKFSDGTSDPDVGAGNKLVQLGENTGANQCSSEASLGDLVNNVNQGGGCAGAHDHAFKCGSGRQGQNSCCARGGGSFGDNGKYVTYGQTKEQLFDCLQMMWDEGITEGQKGHWLTMKNPAYTQAMCGFAWNKDGRLFMNQDFAGTPSSESCSCDGKQAGADDGCGGKCVAFSTAAAKPCEDEGTRYRSSSCTGANSACTCPDMVRVWGSGACDRFSVTDTCRLSCGVCTTAPGSGGSNPVTTKATTQPTTQPTTKKPASSGGGSSTGGLPVCSTDVSDKRGKCMSCFLNEHCIDGFFCCPYMKKCVSSSSMTCFGPVAGCNPTCGEWMASKKCGPTGCHGCDSCSTTNGPGAGKKYGWLEWLHLAGSDKPWEQTPTCSERAVSAPPATTKATTQAATTEEECDAGRATLAAELAKRAQLRQKVQALKTNALAGNKVCKAKSVQA